MLHHVIVSDKPRSWDLVLPHLLWAYRNMPNETTSISPYEMIFGHEGSGALDVLRDTWTGDIKHSFKLNASAIEYLETLKKNLKIAQDAATLNSTKMENAYIEHYNQRT